MNVRNLITEDTIVFDASITTKERLLDEAAGVFVRAGFASDKLQLLSAFQQRESEALTGIEDGFGIPHAKCPCVTKPGIAFFHTGVIDDYLGFDDLPIECSFVIVCPNDAPNTHLEALSELAKRLMDEGFRDRVKSARDSSGILRAISE